MSGVPCSTKLIVLTYELCAYKYLLISTKLNIVICASITGYNIFQSDVPAAGLLCYAYEYFVYEYWFIVCFMPVYSLLIVFVFMNTMPILLVACKFCLAEYFL